ncbi:MAG TPA: CbtA family protein, partial [Afifellaceae bacterium]|nr:CbtA family protein [Afifellaceae bacterium]
MIRALILSAAIAGLAGGLVAACYQAFVVTPLILAAEVFEHAGEASGGVDLSRHALTSLASVILATGGALILLGLMMLDGGRITARRALPWGAGAVVALALAPAIGLPPELPGMPAADLVERQVWWLATVLATGFGLWTIFRRRGAAAIVLGALVIALPHVVGAPQPVSHDSAVPAGLAAQFVAASLAGSALL